MSISSSPSLPLVSSNSTISANTSTSIFSLFCQSIERRDDMVYNSAIAGIVLGIFMAVYEIKLGDYQQANDLSACCKKPVVMITTASIIGGFCGVVIGTIRSVVNNILCNLDPNKIATINI